MSIGWWRMKFLMMAVPPPGPEARSFLCAEICYVEGVAWFEESFLQSDKIWVIGFNGMEQFFFLVQYTVRVPAD
ncbi:hypothetical protein TNCT_542301 [Trichonephila clavata]|uniref:Uncharacterized protein n=1 Tax=Trichonephila clavata TaxID=2740835 RepID=A0A8X6H5P7_TRICU|nr:hypothetical protein TNCT_542301 [Trichonephila clavata]